MSLKMILVAAMALVMVSCGGGGGGSSAATQKKSATASFRAISALGPAIFTSLLSNKPRLQATETIALTCDSGAGTIDVTSTDTSLAIVLKTSDAGCTESGTTTKATGAGLSMTFTGSGDYETSNYSFTLAINGGATITTGSSTEAFTYSNFSVKFDVQNTGTAQNPVISVTITFNGSVTSTADGVQTFNNVVYNSTDLN